MIQINGQLTDRIDALDRGLQYGDGLFETVLVRQGEAVFWKAHLDRLMRDAGRIGIPLDLALIEAESSAFMRRISSSESSDRSGILKLVVTRGRGGRGYRPPDVPDPNRILQWHPLPPHLQDQQEQGIAVMTCSHPVSTNPALAGIKHLNRLDQVMASRELRAPCSEGLMLDTEGMLVEGTRSNIFMVRHGTLSTPSLQRCGVAGILRSCLMQIAASQGIDVELMRQPPEILFAANEVFVCNSVVGILPVTELAVQSRVVKFPVGPVTRYLQGRLREWSDQ